MLVGFDLSFFFFFSVQNIWKCLVFNVLSSPSGDSPVPSSSPHHFFALSFCLLLRCILCFLHFSFFTFPLPSPSFLFHSVILLSIFSLLPLLISFPFSHFHCSLLPILYSLYFPDFILALSTLSFPSCSLSLYIFPPFSLRWNAPDATGSPDRGTEPEPAAVRPIQRPPGAERCQPPHSSTPAAGSTSPSRAPYGRSTSRSVPASACGAGAAVPGAGRAATAPGEAAGGSGCAGCGEPSPTAADAAPNTTAAANAAGHAAGTGRE